ncbi:CdiA family toxin C-terminal domain-containing protein, partial [Lysinibacillus sp. OL1_EC]
SPKPSNSQPPQNGSNKKPDENKGTGNLVFKSDYDNHLINVQGFNRDASKGITGGHNMDEFYNYFRNVEKLDDKDFIHKVTPHPTIDGIIQINYKIPKLDNKGNLTGEYKHFKNPKTVYDPSKISDATIIEWGKDAMQQGIDAGSIVGRKITGINPNGLKFEGYMDANGTITNFYPKLD